MGRPNDSKQAHPQGGSLADRSGLTLIELSLAMAVFAVLATMGVIAYQSSLERARVVEVIGDIQEMSSDIEDYYVVERTMPESLAEVGYDEPLDPWGNPYQYLPIQGNPDAEHDCRKDRNLHPINTDYDLFSCGPDGRTAKPLTAARSRDDIVRANDGAYIGVAEDY
ncbi:MAG: prepilin-type N-terminal cleavage/methylation domain-containing protein [Candidatus Eisenbacteria bacterium]|nr:prepilin-type N-terminal cleavage/methylation domain-containing protein [Candidatus Eisenbacteria bacterium]MCC7140640.1 prepilin-type N-terminal cleavage/methylation domain-containing protein [Candidatus Eisenbacteria bacterium]